MRWLHRPSRIEFEYGHERHNSRPAEWLLLALSVAFIADLSWSLIKVKRITEMRTAQLADVLSTNARTTNSARRYVPKNVEAELAIARTTLRKIALPWNDLFKALSESSVDDVSVMSVEPMAEAGTVGVTAEARNIPAMLTFVSRLESNAFFPTVTLTRHETKTNDPRHPVVFALTATWKNSR